MANIPFTPGFDSSARSGVSSVAAQADPFTAGSTAFSSTAWLGSGIEAAGGEAGVSRAARKAGLG